MWSLIWQGLTDTLFKSMMRDAAKSGRLGLMMGVLGTVERGVGVAAPLLGGPAYEHLGPAAPALLAAGFAMCALALTRLLYSSAAEGRTKPKGD